MPNPSPFEQSLLEQVNRARANPAGEFDVLIDDAATHTAYDADVTNSLRVRGPVGDDGEREGIDLDLLRTQLDAIPAVAPLAWNDDLAEAADIHAAYLIETDQQVHAGPNNTRSIDRAQDAGYDLSQGGGISENIYAFSKNDVHSHAGMFIDWSLVTESGIQEPPGHRNSIVNPNRVETGISVVEVTDPAKDVGPFMMVQVFGNRGSYMPQLLGVVISDGDGDDFYDMGEGLGGVTVTAEGAGGTFTTTTWNAGGYQMALAPGTYDVTFSGGPLGEVVLETGVTMPDRNFKLDAVLEAPAALTGLSATEVSVPENSTGPLLTVTAPADYTVTFAGADAGLFILEGDALRFAAPPDFETPADAGADNVYDLEVVFESPATTPTLGSAISAEAATITVTDVNETVPAPSEGVLQIGTDGPDVLEGTAFDDTLAGQAGNDSISAGDGDDNISGADGNDTIDGGAGDDNIGGGLGGDTVRGGAGNDTIGGGRGNDTATGNGGDDIVNGGQGDDMLYGEAGDDTSGAGFGDDIVSGGAGHDSLGGGTGQDTLFSHDGDDAIGGGEGDDSISGGAGDDFLAGGGRDDTIDGGAGNDTLNSGAGSDLLRGGAGADVFVWTSGDAGAVDRIEDFEDGLDSLTLAGVQNAPGSGLAGKLAALDVTDVLIDGAAGVRIAYHAQFIEIVGVTSDGFGLEDLTFL
ncbi:CAP domain-containing protein [Roseivivax marinus]|uniref:CAP domain-containing protein n=1 Tax=Roseivivax marinus TaxID=1379903 RepID=UPI00273F196E|nr:CAP domain-containing protein [Roseivivax marinus]